MLGTTFNENNLSDLGPNVAISFLLPTLGNLSNLNSNFFEVGIPILEVRKHCLSLLCIKDRKVRSELRERVLIRETQSTLRIFFKDKEVDGCEEEIIFEIRTGFPSFYLGRLVQPVTRCTKRKSYFQFFCFNFFSMAVMKPFRLSKLYQLVFPASLGAFCTMCTTRTLGPCRPTSLVRRQR